MPLTNRFHDLLTRTPFLVLLFFLLVHPLLLNPTVYGLLGVCAGFSGLIVYLRRRRIDLAVLRSGMLLAGVSAVSTVFSGYAWNAFEYTFILVLATVLFAAISEPDDERIRFPIFLACLALGGLLLAKVLIEYFHQVELFGWYGLARLPLADLRNPNVLARFFGMIGLGLIVTAPSLRLRLLGVPFLLLFGLSASKGAMLALGIAGLFWMFRKGLLPASTRWMLITGGGLILPVLVYIAVYPESVGAVTALQRVKLVWESMMVWFGRPFTGVGPWNFGLVYPSVSLDGQWQRHPHMLPLWLLTSFGLVGTVVLPVGVIALFDGELRGILLLPLVFVGAHELVDTMVWIPGVLLLTLFVAMGELRGTYRSARGSYLYLFLCLALVAAGFVVWKTDRDFKKGLHSFERGRFEQARGYWWNDLAGFPVAHRAVAFARDGSLSRAQQSMKHAMVFNKYDPYYRLTMATMLKRSRRKRTARSYLDRYDEMDPHGMLTLRAGGSDGSESSRRSTGREVSFLKLWFNQRKPRYYVTFVRRALKNENTDRAKKQLRFLLDLPKLTRQGRSRLLRLKARLNETTDSDVLPESVVATGGLSKERILFRNQFHSFHYRRPGRDHVFFGSNDQSYYDAYSDP